MQNIRQQTKLRSALVSHAEQAERFKESNMTRYQRDRELRRALMAHKYRSNDRGDYIIGAVGVIGCIVCVALALMGVI